MKTEINAPEVNSEFAFEKWKNFLQDDARKNGGTASCCVRHGGELIRITACSMVIITEPITEFEFILDRAIMLVE